MPQRISDEDLAEYAKTAKEGGFGTNWILDLRDARVALTIAVEALEFYKELGGPNAPVAYEALDRIKQIAA